ncbi:MAG: formate/nitrite transporter family protein [Bacilli bacterium]|jgi:formate/nitrite transporter FocA (FNT family)
MGMSEVTKLLKTYVSSFIAGLLVVLGASIYLLLFAFDLRPIGAVMFASGLIVILIFGFHLYTGMIGYAFSKDKASPLSLLIVLLGNATAVIAIGYLFSLLRLTGWNALFDIVDGIADNRAVGSGEEWYRAIINGFFCGIFVFLAVHSYKVAKPTWLKILGVAFFISLFVLAGTEHCIANMFFFSLGSNWNVGTLLNTGLVIIGNSLGSLFIWFVLSSIEIARQKR